MRLIHLSGLLDGASPAFQPSEPLMIPSWFLPHDSEQVIELYQRATLRTGLQRIDVQWPGDELRPHQDQMLSRARLAFGSSGVFLVVRLRSQEPSSIAALTGTAMIKAFDHVCFVCAGPTTGETWRTLSDLNHHIQSLAEEAFFRFAELTEVDASLDVLDDILPNLWVPGERVRLICDLLRDRTEGRFPTGVSIKSDLVWKKLRELDNSQRYLLFALTVGKKDDARRRLGSRGYSERLGELRGRMLVRDGRPSRWARWLEDHRVRTQLFEGSDWSAMRSFVMELPKERPVDGVRA